MARFHRPVERKRERQAERVDDHNEAARQDQCVPERGLGRLVGDDLAEVPQPDPGRMAEPVPAREGVVARRSRSRRSGRGQEPRFRAARAAHGTRSPPLERVLRQLRPPAARSGGDEPGACAVSDRAMPLLVSSSAPATGRKNENARAPSPTVSTSGAERCRPRDVSCVRRSIGASYLGLAQSPLFLRRHGPYLFLCRRRRPDRLTAPNARA